MGALKVYQHDIRNFANQNITSKSLTLLKMNKKRNKEITLSEKLSSLIQTKPSVIESDDEDLTTVDKITANENDSEYSADELEESKFRKINNRFLDEDDNKYSGKGVSRKDLADSDVSEHEDIEDKESSIEDESEGSNDEEDSKIASENDSDFSEKETTKKQTRVKKQDDGFNKEIFSKATSDIEKGKGIKNQLHIWDFLLEYRMKFQKCLLASNQYPNYKNLKKFQNQGGPEFQSSITQCKTSLKHLLHSLLSLQDALLKSNKEFLSSANSSKEQSKVEDEEIKSDSENEEIKDEVKIPVKKLKNVADFSQEINRRHKNFEVYRNNTIQKWNDKTRIGYISNKNFSAFEQSTLKQIEHVLLDKSRLIKRTQTKRSSYHILGETEDEPPTKMNKLEEEDPLANSLESKNKGLQKEIFDDDDFYHQLLNELVKRKANDVTDPVQLGRQWMQLQKIRSKMKKTVDVKASKGRKVRFVVHPKLVNFMMPINNSVYNEDSRVELFNSLFGKNKK